MLNNYKEFKKLILKFYKENWWISDDTLYLIWKKTWNISTIDKPLLIQLENAKNRIIKELENLETAKVMKRTWYKPYKTPKQWLKQVYLAEFEGEYYKINKVIFDNL